MGRDIAPEALGADGMCLAPPANLGSARAQFGWPCRCAAVHALLSYAQQIAMRLESLRVCSIRRSVLNPTTCRRHDRQGTYHEFQSDQFDCRRTNRHVALEGEPTFAALEGSSAARTRAVVACRSDGGAVGFAVRSPAESFAIGGQGARRNGTLSGHQRRPARDPAVRLSV